MAELKAQKTADPLAALPSAKEVMEQIALKEAEKASAAMPRLYLYAQYGQFTCNHSRPICDRSNFFTDRWLWMRTDKERCHG